DIAAYDTIPPVIGELPLKPNDQLNVTLVLVMLDVIRLYTGSGFNGNTTVRFNNESLALRTPLETEHEYSPPSSSP
uniref:Uncharacterized protein n=1 Tax=Amphimedon queenslandica TaxID=400682 RepID=A0A1X7VCD0_AMPQE